MRLQIGVVLVRMGEFSHFRTSWHTIGTLDSVPMRSPTRFQQFGESTSRFPT